MSEIRQLKKEIDKEVRAIWLDEPEDIKKLRLGVIDSGAGSYGQYFSTYMFADGEVRALGYMSLTTLFHAINDPAFELSHIYKLSRMLLPVCGEYLGYSGLNTLWDFVRRYLEVMEKTDSRDELKGLIESLVHYVNRLHGWIHFYAPWGLGTQFPFKTKEDVAELSRLVGS